MPEPSGMRHGRASMTPGELGAKGAAVWYKVRAILAPDSLGPDARGTAQTIRHEGAERFRAFKQATHVLRDLRERLDAQPRPRQVELWDAYEKGVPTGDREIDLANHTFRAVTEQRTKELIRLDKLKAESMVRNYIGRFWSDPHNTGQLQSFVGSIFSKRPFEGRKSFLKQRELEHFVDGLDRRLTPATYNYVESQLAKIEEMERLIGAEHMLRAEREKGRAAAVMLGQDLPVDSAGEKWVAIDREGNDPAFTIYAPPVVNHWEAVDAIVYGKLQQLVNDLGFSHERKVKVGGGAAGYAQGTHLTTKFGGPEGVLMHEMGHALDYKYGLRSRIQAGIGSAPTRTAQKGKKAGQQVPDYKAEADDARLNRRTLRSELRNLANLRRETMGGVPESKDLEAGDRAYLHSWPEKMANMVEAYVSARDRFKQVAPGIFKIFDGIVEAHAELHPLRDIRPSLSREAHVAQTRLAGPVLAGRWYAPKNSAAVWHNHLSRGLRSNPLYGAFTAPGRAASQILLGLSGFHFSNIAREGIASDLALAVDRAVEGNATEAARRVGSAFASPALTAFSSLTPRKFAKMQAVAFGQKVMNEYLAPGTRPELARVVDAMVKGGFRGQSKSELWTGDRTEALKTAVRHAIHGTGAINRAWAASRVPMDAVMAGIELAAHPLMGKYVPLMKTSTVYHMAAKRLDELGPTADADTIEREMWDIVKEGDLRFGHVTYDNFFINNIAKDLAQAIFLAPGWTFGYAALAGRGVRDLGAAPKRLYDRATGKPGAKDQPVIGKSGKYWIAGVVALMALNGLLTYLYTGEMPGHVAGRDDGWKDFFAHRDGSTDDDGNPNRRIIPGPEMHDVYGWTHHPLETLMNKRSPFLAFALRAAQNRNYYGDLVWNPDDSKWERAKQFGRDAEKELGTPLSFQNFEESKRRDEKGFGAAASNFFGVTPAKREFVRTEAQNKMHEFLARRGHDARTPEQIAGADSRRSLLDQMRKGILDRADVRQAERAGDLTKAQGRSLITRAKESALEASFKQLTLDEARVVYDMGTAEEKAVWDDAYVKKQRAARRNAVGGAALEPQP